MSGNIWAFTLWCYIGLYLHSASPSTLAGTNATVTVSEGESVNISCTSSGGPVPTVTWTINNQPTSFSQTDVITNPTDTTTPGHVMSTLHIVNAQYPTHNGVYTCTGTNTISSSARTDSATVTVQLQCKLFIIYFNICDPFQED